MQKRFILFLLLSAAIFLGWQFVVVKQFPELAGPTEPKQVTSVSPSPVTQSPSPAPSQTETQAQQPPAPTAQVDQREIGIRTEFWEGRLSNRGAVLTEWKVTRFTDGKQVDPRVGGVTLVSAEASAQVGAPFRLFIPSDNALEKELNSALYAPKLDATGDLVLARGEEKEVSFSYQNSNGVVAEKKLVFNGSGYDFGVQVSVSRNSQPIEVFLVVGPNFGDQSITEHSTYRPPPQVTYAVGTSIDRETPAGANEAPRIIQASPLRWASVDDNYFAMALVSAKPSHSLAILNSKQAVQAGGKQIEQSQISVGLAVAAGDLNHVYAGPKDLNTLTRISQKFGLADGSGNLEDLVNYGWLSFISFMIKPLAHFMLNSLLFINNYTHNYGWAIVVLTIVLNMFFFPLRWKSSVAMRRTAAMQPKMKDLQDRIKKLDKNDPRMPDLQKEQIALMREGNPLMGCLPLLLQMPFFLAVFTILTVSIEVRHAPFVGWISDLSAPDPYWILPIAMCVSMIVQTALTPSTADPMQKRISYLMPLVFTYFLTSAPAGLVLYWMMSNLVGIAQQFVINRLNPPPPPAAANQSQADKPKTPISKGKKAKAQLKSA